jgi:hypothetical protein
MHYELCFFMVWWIVYTKNGDEMGWDDTVDEQEVKWYWNSHT